MKDGNTGFSAVEVLVGFVILAIGMVALGQAIFTFDLFDLSLNKRRNAEQILLTTSSAFQNLNYSVLWNKYCHPAVISQYQKKCATGGVFNLANPTTPDAVNNPAGLSVRRNWKGDPDTAAGPVCVELASCVLQAGNLLKVQMVGVWTSGHQTQQATLDLRRTRW